MIDPTGFLVDRSDFSSLQRDPGLDPADRPVASGEVLLETRLFGLTSNNISYASAGDMLGYWSFFPAPEGLGRIPVWGFAEVVRSEHSEISVGERLFGFLPMAPHVVIAPTRLTALALSDGSSPRSALHTWYNRYYRCDADPALETGHEGVQPVLWALFMTGWKLAEHLDGTVDEVWVSSASSKTAVSMAWSMRRRNTATNVVGVTSAGNADFVHGLGVYDRVVTYDDLGLDGADDRIAYVDMAGNGAVTAAIHAGLGERLVDSVLVGGTHRARSDDEPVGPPPRFFFIPAVAESEADEIGLDEYHRRFAAVWCEFAPWVAGWIELDRGSGLDDIESAYERIFSGASEPDRAAVLSWS